MERERAICPACGASFERDRMRQRYCSARCRDRAKSRAATKRKQLARPPKVCPICGNEFPDVRGRKYCSQACRDRAKAQHDRLYRELARGAKAPKICPVCGNEFTPRSNCQRYCSPRCASKAKQRARYLRQRQQPEAAQERYEAADGDGYDEEYTGAIPGQCIRCTMPRAEGSTLCEHHMRIREMRERRKRHAQCLLRRNCPGQRGDRQGRG